MTDQEPIAVAIKTALTAALPAGVDAYDLDEVPGTHGNAGDLPAQYVLVFVSRRWVPERLASGAVTIPGGRLVTRYCAAEYIGNARELRRITAATLEDKGLPIAGGGEVGPFAFEVEDIVREAARGFSGSDTWTF